MMVDGRRDEDITKAIATLALTSKAAYPTNLLREVIEYCMIQLEHRLGNEELCLREHASRTLSGG